MEQIKRIFGGEPSKRKFLKNYPQKQKQKIKQLKKYMKSHIKDNVQKIVQVHVSETKQTTTSM